MGHTVRTESGSIAEVSHPAYSYRSAKYDMSNKNDTIFQLCRQTRSISGFSFRTVFNRIPSISHNGICDNIDGLTVFPWFPRT